MYHLTGELQQLIKYKYPNDFKYMYAATEYLNQCDLYKCICIHGFFGSGKTKILLIIRLILEYYNVPVVAVTFLNIHANKVDFKTVHGQFNINWNSMIPMRMPSGLYNPKSVLLIDDAFLCTDTLLNNLETFFRQKFMSNAPWGGRRIIVTATTIPTTTTGLSICNSNNNNSNTTTNSLGILNDNVNWIKYFKTIELNAQQPSETLIQYTHKIQQQQQQLPTSAQGCVHLNAGLIITWNHARVSYYNTLCQTVKMEKNSSMKHVLPAWRKTHNKLIATKKNNVISKRRFQYIPIDTCDDTTVLCDNDVIMITQSTASIQKGTMGTYVHPFKIKTSNNNILPISKVKILKFNTEYKVYPVCLAYALTLNKIMGEKFPSIQIDLCQQSVSFLELCAAISRSESLQNVTFITNDVKVI